MNFYDVTGRQIRDARELLGLSPHQLGIRSGVSRLTLRLWEASGDEPPNALAPNLSRVLRYLHSEGVQFDGDGTVHLRCASHGSQRWGRSMKSERDLVDSIFKTALEGCGAT